MRDLVHFVEACETGTDRSTFYNSATQQTDSIENLHQEMLNLDRELYTLLQALPGINHYNRLIMVRQLLFQTGYLRGREGRRTYLRYGPAKKSAVRFGDDERERDWVVLENRIIREMVWPTIPVPRLLREWAVWRSLRLNNNRSKRLLLEFLLGSTNLTTWALKYRPNLRRVVSHAWGDARTRRLRSEITQWLNCPEDAAISPELRQWVFRFVPARADTVRQQVEALAFIFDDLRHDFTVPRFAQYVKAIKDPEQLPGLPYDIALGLRNRVHPRFPARRLLDSAKTQQHLSAKQRVRLQRSAERKGATVDMDLSALSLVDIIKYGYEMGFDRKVMDAVRGKVDQEAAKCAFRPASIAVVVDTSQSMRGSGTRKLHPIAVAEAVSLVLKRVAGRCTLIHTGGPVQSFPRPRGDTDLVTALLRAFQADTEMIFLISDGYENVTAGTAHDMVRAIRALAVRTPLIHLNPVLAAEAKTAGGLRSVSEDAYTLPVFGPESITSLYDKFMLMWASNHGAIAPLKRFLLDRLHVSEVPRSITRAYRDVPTLARDNETTAPLQHG